MVLLLVAYVMGTISPKIWKKHPQRLKRSCQDKVQENIRLIVSMVPLARAIKKSGWILAI